MAPKNSGITADVAFDSAEDMQWAIETHNGITKIRGRTLTLKPSATDPCAAVVGNLPADIDGDELSVLFAEGEAEDVGDGEDTAEAEEPQAKKAKTGKTAVKKTSSRAAADNSEDEDASSPPVAADKTWEVRFADPSHAPKAVKKLNDTWWDDTTQVRVRLDDGGEKIFLRVATAGVTWQDVKAFCGEVGAVSFAGEKGKGKGKGEVKGKGKTKGGKPLPPDSDSSGDEGGGGGKGKGKSKGADSGPFKVKFHDPKHAKKAVKKLHDAWWDDKRQAKVKEDSECWEGATVIITLPGAGFVMWSHVKTWCEQIGSVVFVSDLAIKGKGKSKSKGKSWGKASTGEFEVRYEEGKAAAKCVKKLNGAWWDDYTQAWAEQVSEDKCIIYLDDSSIKWQDVKDWAATVGTVSFCGPKGKGKGKSSDEW